MNARRGNGDRWRGQWRSRCVQGFGDGWCKEMMWAGKEERRVQRKCIEGGWQRIYFSTSGLNRWRGEIFHAQTWMGTLQSKEIFHGTCKRRRILIPSPASLTTTFWKLNTFVVVVKTTLIVDDRGYENALGQLAIVRWKFQQNTKKILNYHRSIKAGLRARLLVFHAKVANS